MTENSHAVFFPFLRIVELRWQIYAGKRWPSGSTSVENEKRQSIQRNEQVRLYAYVAELDDAKFTELRNARIDSFGLQE